MARARNDGYTLLLTTNSTHSVVHGLFKTVPYDPIKDFTPIARIGSFASFIAVTPDNLLTSEAACRPPWPGAAHTALVETGK